MRLSNSIKGAKLYIIAIRSIILHARTHACTHAHTHSILTYIVKHVYVQSFHTQYT